MIKLYNPNTLSWDLNSLCSILRLGWYRAIVRAELQGKVIRRQLSGVVGLWKKKMSGSAEGDETKEGSNIDETNCQNTELYVDVKRTQWPIVYAPEYNIGFLGLERLHPFDAGKWGKVYNFLKDDGMIRDDTTIRPKEATEEDLRVVHTKRYINSLRWSIEVAGITEVPPVAILPNFIVQRKVLRPFRYQTGGTILAAKLAMERGWGINIGGGFHHCSSERGGGFCAYADITLAIKFLFERNPRVEKAMIIDLDAHQGNGHERDFMDDEKVYIMDVYNRQIYPHDGFAKRAIKRKIELYSYTEDAEYLDLVNKHVEGALNEFKPDIIVYNAGTDILEGDPLGHLNITPKGIIDRDQIVFEHATSRNIPIMMVTSGGYQRTTARIIADSIKNLKTQKLIACEEAENAPSPKTSEAEYPRSLGIPRSQSESGLFAKIRNFCFSKSPTQESIPPPIDTNSLNIPNLSSTKSSSDLNLPTQKTSEIISEENAIDFVEEKVVEKFALEFKAKKTESENAIKDVLSKEAGPQDETRDKDTKVAWPRHTISDTNESYLTKDLLHFEEDKSIAVEDKGARPKNVPVTDTNEVKDNGSSHEGFIGFNVHDDNVNISSVGCEISSLVEKKTIEQEEKRMTESISKPTNESKNQNGEDIKQRLDQNKKMNLLDLNNAGNIFYENNSVTKDSKSKTKDNVPDNLLGCVTENEKKTSESTLPQITNAASVMSATHQDATSIDVFNNNLRVTSAGEITAVTPDSGEDKISDILMASSNGNASDDEWSDFVVYNPDKNCDKSE